MRKAASGLGFCAAVLMAGAAMAAQPAAPATQPQHNATPFPPGQVPPNFETGANNVGASLQHPGSNAPNAGVTGVWPGSRDSKTGLGGNGAPQYTR